MTLHLCLSRFVRSAGRLAAALPALALLAGTAGAVRPTVWEQQTYEEFAQGKAKGVWVAASGGLELAPALEGFARFEAERIWSLLVGPDGTLYAGTGDEGRIFAVDRQGQARLLFDSPELAIHALALGPDGTLYAGTSPDGLIYAIDRQGQATTLARTGCHYVWDLALDADGQLYAATGDTAQVLAVSRQGEVSTLCTLADQHAMALLLTPDRLYASTARAGRVYELALASPGRARLLAETGEEEVNALVPGRQGVLYAGAVSQPAGPQETKDGQKSAVYRIDPAGAVYPVWQEEKAVLLDLEADSQGRLLLAVGEPGRLYRLDQEQRADLLAQFEDFEPSRLRRGPDGALYVGAAQAGRVERLSGGVDQEGQYESPVKDFQVQSRWGTLNFLAELPAGSQVQFQTRSGNSQTPDDTWSPWSAEVQDNGQTIASPPARFLQYRALLKAGQDHRSPRLRRVAIAAAQANLRPVIAELQTSPFRPGQPGGEGQEAGGGVPAGAERPGNRPPTQRKSLRLVRWQVQDPNGDKLSYDLYLRGANQREWKLAEENLSVNSVVWDTETMPEGLTELKLVASDRPDNPPDQALEAECLATPFAIDNSPPLVELQARAGAEVEVEVVVRDRISPVQRLQYSVDYSDQVVQVGPLDGLFDSQEEKARFAVAGLAPGEHVISVQAWDALDNVGVQQVVVQVK